MKDLAVEKKAINHLRKNGSVKGEIELKRVLSTYGINISLRRLRRICFHSKSIEVEVKFGKGKCRLGGRCPVCQSVMIPIINKDLDGNSKILGYKCKMCNFNSISNGKPYLYIFRLKNHDF